MAPGRVGLPQNFGGANPSLNTPGGGGNPPTPGGGENPLLWEGHIGGKPPHLVGTGPTTRGGSTAHTRAICGERV